MKRYGKLKPIRFDEKELKTDLGTGNFIFVGSSCDMFAKDVPIKWIDETTNYCKQFDNQYLFQSKNPARFYNCSFPKKTILATTIESNRMYSSVYSKAITVNFRANLMAGLKYHQRMVTIEPIMDFDLEEFVELIDSIKPFQVNIGADSKRHNLPEPSRQKVQELISELKKFDMNIFLKDNLKRLQ